jgi:hypothetical protein
MSCLPSQKDPLNNIDVLMIGGGPAASTAAAEPEPMTVS